MKNLPNHFGNIGWLKKNKQKNKVQNKGPPLPKKRKINI